MLLYKQLKSRICHNRHSGNFAASVISCIRFSDLWHSVFIWNEYAVIISQNPFFYTKRNGIKISYGYANHWCRHHSRIWNPDQNMRLYHPVFHFLRNAADTAVSGALVFADRHRILRSYKRCCAAFHLCLHQTDKISSGSVISVMGRIVRHFSGLFHPSPDRPLAPELCITENNPLTVNRWMLYSFTLPGHPHLKLKYW